MQTADTAFMFEWLGLRDAAQTGSWGCHSLYIGAGGGPDGSDARRVMQCPSASNENVAILAG